MSEDRVQRQMDFIIEQQARFAQDITRLSEENRQNTANIAKLADVVMSLARHVERHNQDIATLIEQSKETGERLNALINLFERHITDSGK